MIRHPGTIGAVAAALGREIGGGIAAAFARLIVLILFVWKYGLLSIAPGFKIVKRQPPRETSD